ncbi:MAG TPA: CCA tRNA nucleotidyltransferase [Candidatus Limnocylindrales bacterium]|nr:CCA tRNA nucleotidyltransferase [Candidatus Limnocylindrales bacterium]
MPDSELTYIDLPPQVVRVLRALGDARHEAALVGGVVRDRVRGVPLRESDDWDAATSARPEEVAALFADATWENRFGTVTITGRPTVEVTSYRTEGGYRDRRRPDEVRFGASLTEDLARRDFTINALAWIPIDLEAGQGRIVDPFDGARDLRAGLLRTVGDPRERFDEDALRLVRAARFAGRLGLAIDPETEAAILEVAPTVATVSAERVRDELLRMLDDAAPSSALRHLERWGLLALLLPELAALRGVPQAKLLPGDALDHALASVDAAPASDRALRLAALLHDIGKATTQADGHFIGHDRVGAEMAAQALHRLRVPASLSVPAVDAIRQHMYAYDDSWTDAAVRRFIRRVGEPGMALLFALRRADDVASGVGSAGEASQLELERRIGRELERSPDVLIRNRLSIDGNDLQEELGWEPGPRIGRALDRLMEAVLDDPSLNRREVLLGLARDADANAVTERTGAEPGG